MLRPFRLALLFSAMLTAAASAQSLCPHYLVSSPMVVNIEGRFVNVKHSRVSMDVEWRHHPESIDTFFVNLADREQFKFITTGNSRYVEMGKSNIKRQLGTHHLKENIGETPLKLDDMELLANGQFVCKDASDTSAKSLGTAFSMAWWSIMSDTLPTPQKVVMRGANRETRIFTIGQWKIFSGELLPTLVSLTGPNYQGSIWIRSAYPIQALESDPLQKAATKVRPIPELFLKIPVKRKREIPLILKLNQELLRE
ncbi:MAG: hypothetical protein II892_07685 [Fibrobacter sp.]|nr:hypothetical protein [Fibrobacter sp.]